MRLRHSALVITMAAALGASATYGSAAVASPRAHPAAHRWFGRRIRRTARCSPRRSVNTAVAPTPPASHRCTFRAPASSDSVRGGCRLRAASTGPRGTGGARAGASAACQLTYDGSPNGVQHVGASGGDIDTAFAPVKSTAGTYRIYVASCESARSAFPTSATTARRSARRRWYGGSDR